MSPPALAIIFCFSLLAILTGVRGWLVALSISLYLMVSDIERLLMCLLVVWMSSLEKCLLKSSAHLKIGLFGFCD